MKNYLSFAAAPPCLFVFAVAYLFVFIVACEKEDDSKGVLVGFSDGQKNIVKNILNFDNNSTNERIWTVTDYSPDKCYTIRGSLISCIQGLDKDDIIGTQIRLSINSSDPGKINYEILNPPTYPSWIKKGLDPDTGYLKFTYDEGNDINIYIEEQKLANFLEAKLLAPSHTVITLKFRTIGWFFYSDENWVFELQPVKD